MKKLITNKHLFHTLKEAKPKLRKAIIKNMNLNSVKAFAEIAKNTLNGVTNIIGTKFLTVLKKYKNKLRLLASNTTNLSVKRKILLSSGALIVILLDAIFSGTIGEIISEQSL